MKKVYFVLTFLAVLLLVPTCKKNNPEQEKIDVQFEVPAQMTIDDGASEISFRVQFSKPPVSGDQIILGSETSEYACPVTSVSDTHFSASISGVWSKGFGPGTYTVSHQRGSTKTRKGTMDVIVKYAGDEEVEPATGSTVYGKVSCEGTGLAGVVVSDGVEVVKTDSKGVYQMKSKKLNGYVFVSTPSGYEPLASGLLPRFHAQLKANAATAERVDFQLKKVEGQDNHRMLMLGDIHLAARNDDRKQFAEFVKDLNATVSATPGKVYALTLGDMTWDLYWLDNHYSFKEYLSDAAGIKGVMLYHTIGNHDHSMYYMGDFDTVKDYKENIGPTYYSFNIGKVHYVVLDDVECTNSTKNSDRTDGAYVRAYDGRVVADELAWLRKDLASVPNGTPLVVTMHIPLYNNKGQYGLKEASTLANVLKPYPEVHLYTAHTHTVYNKDELATDHIFEHNAGAICATWWWTGKLTPGVHIGQDGSPGGYTVAVQGHGEGDGLPVPRLRPEPDPYHQGQVCPELYRKRFQTLHLGDGQLCQRGLSQCLELGSVLEGRGDRGREAADGVAAGLRRAGSPPLHRLHGQAVCFQLGGHLPDRQELPYVQGHGLQCEFHPGHQGHGPLRQRLYGNDDAPEGLHHR